MLDIIKKGVMLGLGAFTWTKEKIEETVDDLIKKGELSKDERAQAIQDFFKKIEEQEKIIKDKISAEVTKAVSKLDIATKQDIARLEKKINDLGKKS